MCRSIAHGGRRCASCTSALGKARRAEAARHKYAAKVAATGRKVRAYRRKIIEPYSFAQIDPLSRTGILTDARQAVATLKQLEGPALHDRIATVERDCAVVGAVVDRAARSLCDVDPQALNQRNQQLIADMADLQASGTLKAVLIKAQQLDTRSPQQAERARNAARDLLAEPLVRHGFLSKARAEEMTFDDVRQLHQQALIGQDPDTRAQLARLRDARTQVLATVRPMGGTLATHGCDTHTHDRTQAVARHLPREWIDQVNASGGVVYQDGDTAERAVSRAVVKAVPLVAQFRDAHWQSRPVDRPAGADDFLPWSRSAAAAAAGVGAPGRVPDKRWDDSTLGALAVL